MRDFNKAIILGNLTRDPEMRYTPNGKPVCSFGVATNRRWTNATGDTQESTEFHNVVCWGKLAETANQILYKGRKTLIEGRLQTRNWEGQDGVRRNKTEIIAENFSALGPAGVRGGEGLEKKVEETSQPEKSELEDVIEEVSEKPKKEKAKKTAEKESSKKAKEDKIDLDDIPF